MIIIYNVITTYWQSTKRTISSQKRKSLKSQILIPNFLVKTGGIKHVGVLSIENGLLLFNSKSRFCDNNALYSISLSFTIFIFLLTPFNT